MVNVDEIISIIIKNDIKIELNEQDYSEPLEELGLDSLDITSILFALEEEFEIKIPEEDINQNKLSSINAIVSYINEIKN